MSDLVTEGSMLFTAELSIMDLLLSSATKKISTNDRMNPFLLAIKRISTVSSFSFKLVFYGTVDHSNPAAVFPSFLCRWDWIVHLLTFRYSRSWKPFFVAGQAHVILRLSVQH
jgi:hypothetical protein